MNLRDFILYKMADYKFGNANNRIGEEFTDDIIKEIEKRIDDIEIPIDYESAESWAFEKGLEKVKELLK